MPTDWQRNSWIAVLFARDDSVYKTLSNCDVYDQARDARTFAGGMPVIAHPPCRTWGRLRHLSKAPPGEHALAPWAVEIVRREGGILEHPAASRLWAACDLPLPCYGASGGGFTIEIDQCWFGHRARKRTWLYISGIAPADLPALPRDRIPPSHVVSTSKRGHGQRPQCTHAEREATPLRFALWLCEVARRAHHGD